MEPIGFTMIVMIIAHGAYSFVVGLFGASKKMGFGESFLLSLFFTPIIAIICVYLNESKKNV